MKIFGCFVLVVGMMASSAIYAQNQNRRDNGTQVRVEVPLEFKIGGSSIKIGGKTYDGRDYRALNERIRNLEVAVQFLLENQGYQGNDLRWECVLTTPFSGAFLGKGDSEISAGAEALNACRDKSSDVDDFYCTDSRIKCTELK